MLDPQIERLMYHEVFIEQFERYSGDGTAIYKSGRTITGNVQGQVRMVRSAEGEEIVSTVTVFLPGTSEQHDVLQQEDRITLPDSRQPPIIGIQRHYTEWGELSMVEVLL